MKHYLSITLSFFLLTSCVSKENTPEDFDAFWEQAMSSRTDNTIVNTRIDSVFDGKRYQFIKLEINNDRTAYIWLSQALDSLPHPIFVKFRDFGDGVISENEIPNKWFLKQRNYHTVVAAIGGSKGLKSEDKKEGFIAEGLELPERYYLKDMYLDANGIIDFLTESIDYNGKLVVSGDYQGATLATAVSVLNSKVSLLSIGRPFFTSLKDYNKQEWPMKILVHGAKMREMSYGELKHTLTYFDMISFSKKIEVPVFVKAQINDPITPIHAVKAFYENINGKDKRYYEETCEGKLCLELSKNAIKFQEEFITENLK